MSKRATKSGITANDFRRIALGMPDAVEASHMKHPDFRVAGKIFATLGYPDNKWGMVALAPEEQQEFVAESPAVFTPVKGAWGRRGATGVLLDAADEDTLGRAITAAWQNTVRKSKPRPRRRT